MTPKRALVSLIVVSALVRLIAAWSLGLGNDEAYHFLYAVHPSRATTTTRRCWPGSRRSAWRLRDRPSRQ